MPKFRVLYLGVTLVGPPEGFEAANEEEALKIVDEGDKTDPGDKTINGWAIDYEGVDVEIVGA